MGKNWDIVVVGAGFAGVASAFHLARSRVGEVLLLERESQAGVHSSGRSATIARQALRDGKMARLARESVAFLRAPRSEIEAWRGPDDLLDPTGLLLLEARGTDLLEGIRRGCAEAEVPLESPPLDDLRQRLPVLRDAPLEGALLSPSDGVIDGHALLTGLLRGAEDHGADYRPATEVVGLERRPGGWRIRTTSDELQAGLLVNAAGAWAGELGAMAGAESLPLRVTRRHLFVSEALEERPGPVVWRVDDPLYFRREGPGLLLSPCDVADHPPGSPSPELEAEELLLRKLQAGFPALAGLRMRTGWAGLRILTPDDRHVLGPDPEVKGLVWAAGLGGHGVTTAWATGRLVAESILEGGASSAFDPGRFR